MQSPAPSTSSVVHSIECNRGPRWDVSPREIHHTLMFYTGTVFTILSIVFGFFLVLLAYWTAAAGLFVKTTDACRQQYAERPVRSTLIGILTFGLMLILVIVLSKGPGAGFVLLAGAVPLLVSFIGTAGLALHIGARLCNATDRWQLAMRGGAILGLCFITPFLGWFIIAPLGLASGFGAFVLAKPWKTKAAPESIQGTPALS
jgi:hypothetical protein